MDRYKPEQRCYRYRYAIGATLTSVALSACQSSAGIPVAPSPASASSSPEISHPKDGCEPFGVYAQNRWAPQGASEREIPDVLARKIGSFAGNEIITIDGWYKTGKAAYHSNPVPWNSDVWMHVRDSGWVAFAAVRQEPTLFDPSSLSPDGGKPVALTPNCEIPVLKKTS